MHLIDFDYQSYSKEKMLIVYGTEGFGKIVHYCLKEKNIVPDYYVNAKGTGYFLGVPIIDINELSEIYREKHPIILLAVGVASKQVILKLSRNKIDEIYSIYSLLETAIEFGELIDPIYGQRTYYFSQQERFIECDKLILDTLDIVVTEKCSLRCGKCSNLMQYYQSPQNLSIYEIRDSLNKVLEFADCIYELRILGGEPFMNPEFYELIDWYKDNPKIKQIVILTNATIFPQDEKLEKLKSPKVKIWLSDYGKLSSKLCDWMSWCENNKIEFLYHRSDAWNDCGNLEKRDYSINELKYIYETCLCRQLPTLLKGKLYNCPYAANAVNLGAMFNSESEMDSLEVNDPKLTKQMIKDFLFERKYLMACDYCNGRYGLTVKPHEQIDKPLSYERKFVCENIKRSGSGL